MKKLMHYAEVATLVAAVPTTAAIIAHPYLSPGLASTVYVAAWIGAAIMAAMIVASARGHSGLCEVCISKMPLDAAALGERYRRQFAALHFMTRTRRRFFFGTLAAFFVVACSAMAWPPSLAVALLAISLGAVTALRHQQLQPWCPYCSGGGGSHEPTIAAPSTPTVGV